MAEDKPITHGGKWTLFPAELLDCPGCGRNVSILGHTGGGKTFLICWDCRKVFNQGWDVTEVASE